MLDDIIFLYDKNFGRTNSLLKLYSALTSGKKGRRPIENLDLLRATVVMLHSTLEDFIRNLMNWKLPESDKEKLKKVPLITNPYDRRKIKFELGELLEHRGKSIEDVIDLSIKQYLDTVSFNNTHDISSSLNDININTTESIRKLYPNLQKMIHRRHNIVHQADRDFVIGGNSHKIKRITLKEVEKWQKTVDSFVLEIVKILRQ